MMLAWRRGFAALIGAALITDGVWLMLLDKINFGTVLPTLIGIGWCLWAWQQPWLNSRLQRTRYLAWAWQAGVIGFFVWLMSLFLFFAYIYASGSEVAPSQQTPTVIMVLGSGLKDSQPTPTLQARLNTAIEQAQRYPDAFVLTAGGLGRNQSITEARAMANYLIAKGASPSRLLLEDRSTSTHENLLFAKPLLTKGAVVLLVSSDFHLPRSKAIAQKVGLSVAGTAPAPAPLQIRYNAWLREYFAFISGWLLNEY